MISGMFPRAAAVGEILGTVEVLAQGTKTDDGAGNATVTVENTDLLWSAADPATGRPEGWALGVKVTAPADVLPEQLPNVSYQAETKDGWSEAVKLSAGEKSVNLWMPVLAEDLLQASQSGSLLKSAWRFDWDADGKYDQTASIQVKPETIKLMQAGEQVYPVPPMKLGSVASSVGTVSGNASETVVVEVKDQTIVWTEVNGNKSWNVILTMTAPQMTAEQLSNVSYQTSTGRKWVPGENTFAADGTLTLTLSLTADMITSHTQKYRFDWDGDGTYDQTVQVNLSNITLGKKDQTGFAFKTANPGTVEVNEKSNYSNVAEGGQTAGEVTYQMVGESYGVSVTHNGVLKVPNVGTYKRLTVQATKPGDEYYNAATATYTVTLTVKNSDWFQQPNPQALTYVHGLTFSNKVGDKFRSPTAKYTIVDSSSENVAEIIDQTEGKLKILKPGTVTVKAEWKNMFGKAQLATYTLTINKGNQDFEFENVNPVIYYGQATYRNTLSSGEDTANAAVIEYALAPNDLGAVINAKTGEITLSDKGTAKTGTLTVTATRQENDWYQVSTRTYTLNVQYLDANPTLVDAENKMAVTPITQNRWVAGPVLIQAPEGCKISKTSNSYAETDWADSIPFIAEGQDETVYLKRIQDGAMTDAIVVKGIRTDGEDPTGLAIICSKPDAESPDKTSYFYATKAVIDLEAHDQASGVESFVLTYTKPDGTQYSETISAEQDAADPTKYTAVKELSDDTNVKISVKAVDKVGRFSEKSGKQLVVDKINPVLAVSHSSFCNQDNNTYYNNTATTVSFVITEANFALSRQPVVSVNGTQKSVKWTPGNGSWTGELALSGNGEYNVQLDYTDAVDHVMKDEQGNEIGSYTETVIISDKKPSVKVDLFYIDQEGKQISFQNGGFVNKTAFANLVVPKEFFKPAGLKIEVTGSDIKGNTRSYDYQEMIQNVDGWKDNPAYPGCLVYALTFSEDNAYHVTFSYEAKNGVKADDQIVDFTVDHDPAKNIKISYSKSFVDKILNGVTFGFYNAPADISLEATDLTSGVESFEITYTKPADSGAGNVESFTRIISAQQDPKDKTKFTATDKLMPQADAVLSVKAIDKAKNSAIQQGDKRIVVDTIHPLIDVSYEYQKENEENANSDSYTQGTVNVVFTMTETNFELANRPVVKLGRKVQSLTWTQQADGSWRAELPLEEEKEYRISASFQDASGNLMMDASGNILKEYKKNIVIDGTKPVIAVGYNDKPAFNTNYYQDPRIATVTITETNFDPQNVEVVVNAVDIYNNPVELTEDYTGYAKDKRHWSKDSKNNNILTLPEFSTDARYTVTVNCKDMSGNDAIEDRSEFVVDQTPAEKVTITYSESLLKKLLEKVTFGFYQAGVDVTVTAEDKTSGIDYFELTYTKEAGSSDLNKESFTEKLVPDVDPENAAKFSATFKINEQIRGAFKVNAVNKANIGREAQDENHVIVVDQANPQISVSYAAIDEQTKVFYRDAAGNEVADFPTAHSAYFNGSVDATIHVTEANFFEGVHSGSEVVHNFLVKVTRIDDEGGCHVTEYLPEGAKKTVDGAETETITWKSEGDLHTASVTFPQDGDYILEIGYTDFSQNDAGIQSNDDKNIVKKNYTSKVITVDSTAPVIDISYDNMDARNGNCYKEDRTATIKVTEHNFRASDFILSLEAKNILNENMTTEDFAAFAKNSDNWTHDGNVHILNLTFTVDAAYSYNVSYTDLAGKASNARESEQFIIDHQNAQNIVITYSTPVLQKVLKALSFGFYQADAVVTVSAEDITSGVDYFELSYTRDPSATDAHMGDFTQKLAAKVGSAANRFTASFTLPAEARGSFKVAVMDRAGNNKNYADQENIIVTDTVSPEVKVTYEKEQKETKLQFVDKNGQNVNTFAEAASAYYNGNVVATVTVKDSNFFEGKSGAEDEIIHNFNLKVTKTDDQGNSVVTDYSAAAGNLDWDTVGDTHTAKLFFGEDGDYVVQIDYTDFSQNDADIQSNDGKKTTKTYTSKTITVDKTAPVVTLKYGNNAVVNTIENREYYAKPQNAVITVQEHNFRAADFVATVEAKNVVGANVAVTDYASYLKNDANWTHKGNVHTAKLDFSTDANYTLDFTMQDIAQNPCADYKQDLFTVDTTAPTNLTVKYSENAFQKIAERLTFGYYNSKVTVTISATDITSGIYHFAYSYLNSAGVSGVNAELLNQAIRGAEITYNGASATAVFSIPRDALGRNNQFNGTVNFTAFDCSENKNQYQDSNRIVVDNISPVANITFNHPVQTANGISYYNGTIQCTININEANFDSGDVVVRVTKDGAAYPVNVTWQDESVDNHNGRFNLTQDGDYTVSVSYRDKSGNQMADYKSNQMTLDTNIPVILVSNIKADSANKDKEYGFTVTIRDVNLDVGSMKPVLKAVLRQKDGKFTTTEIDLGEPRTVISGAEYVYTVRNLAEDAMYTLSASAQDMSGNSIGKVVLDDGKAYEQVQFSVNRKGSVFGFGDEATQKLVNQYYVNNVEKDVVILEVNVDLINDYKVMLNGVELKEGKDYTTTQTSSKGEWSKRTYVINKELFAEEGEYNVVVQSVDKTNTTAFSDVKNLNVSFVVDRTAPTITITGLQNGGRYHTEEQTVTLIPTDEGGRLNELTVIILDSNGKPILDAEGKDISTRFSMSGQELLDYLEANDGKIVFTIPKGLENQIQIICSDCAAKSDGMANCYNESFSKVTVSSSGFVIFYANKPLFFGTIGGVVLVAALIIILILKKKKKEKK